MKGKVIKVKNKFEVKSLKKENTDKRHWIKIFSISLSFLLRRKQGEEMENKIKI